MLFLGIDIGTSSVRCTLTGQDGLQHNTAKIPLPLPENPKAGWYQQSAEIWQEGLTKALQRLAERSDLSRVRAMALDGTSSTVLLTGEQNRPLSKALMYNDQRANAEVQQIRDVSPDGHLTQNAGSSLAKALWLLKQVDKQKDIRFITHQTDWLNSWLTGSAPCSDPNNALKLGYDSLAMRWPDWLARLAPDFMTWLPEVSRSGTLISTLSPLIAQQFGFAEQTRVYRGTTDSTASALASGIHQPGDAVTTLGTTLVMKLVTPDIIESVDDGIYSHRLPDGGWLAGGASNSGGNVLLKYFTESRIESLSAQMHPEQDTGLDYYPLTGRGERFPLNDPDKSPRLEPRPAEDMRFLQGIFEGFARIEKLAYEKIARLGGTYPTKILTVGGAAVNNPALQIIRQRILGVPVEIATHTEASYAMAELARNSFYRDFPPNPH